MSHRHDELMNLLDAWCDDVLTAEQAERIEQIVRADQAAMDLYLLVTHLDGALRWEHERVHVTAADTATQRVQGSAFRVQGKKHTPPLRRSRSVGYTFRDQGSGPRDQNKTSPMASPRAVGLALAAIITLAVTAWFALPDFSNPQSEIRNPQSEIRNPKSFASVATLTHIENAAFADTPAPMNLGGSLPAGPIQLTSGSAQIMFASTAVVDLTGPCEFEMTGPNRGRLTSGSLEASVPENAKGFTIDLPDGSRLVDLGTQFRVGIDPDGRSWVHVLEGEVQCLAPGASTGPKIPVNRPFLIGDEARLIPARAAVTTVTDTLFDSFEPADENAPWLGDPVSVVAAERGVEPEHGAHMLRLDATAPSGSSRHGAAERWRVIDLRLVRSLLSHNDVSAHATVHVNRVAGDERSDTHFRLRLYAHRGDPADYRGPSRDRKPIASVGDDLESDPRPQTWQPLNAELTIPAQTDYLIVYVAASENVHPDDAGPEFDGHYLDSFRLELKPRQTGRTTPQS